MSHINIGLDMYGEPLWTRI